MKVSRRQVVGRERCLTEGRINVVVIWWRAVTSVALARVRTDASRTARVRSGRKSALQEAETPAAGPCCRLVGDGGDFFCGYNRE